MESIQANVQSSPEHSLVVIDQRQVESLIYFVRNKQVMFDEDLADLYQVDTGSLNRAVKRNIDRFPEDFRFQLTKVEYEVLRCQIGISNNDGSVDGRGGRRYMPYVFAEQGIAMLSSVKNQKSLLNGVGSPKWLHISSREISMQATESSEAP